VMFTVLFAGPRPPAQRERLVFAPCAGQVWTRERKVSASMRVTPRHAALQPSGAPGQVRPLSVVWLKHNFDMRSS
jgi:hypothetical protein